MDVTWTLRPGVSVARRPSLHVRRRQVHGRRDQRSQLQPRKHRRVRPHQLGGHTGRADSGRPLQGGVRAVRHPVHPRHAAEASARGAGYRSGAGLQPQPARHRAVSGGGVEGRRIHPARARAPLLARRRVAPYPQADVQVHREHQHAHQPAEERRGARRGAGAVGQATRDRRTALDRRASNARERLRARDAERAPVPAFCRRARQARADPCPRSRALHEDDSRWSRAGRAWSRSSRCRGRTPIESRAIRSIRRARAPCSTRRAGQRARRHPAAGRPSAGLHADHAGRLRHPGKHRAGDRTPAARGRRRCPRRAPRRHGDQRDLVRGSVRRDAPLVADAGGPGAHARSSRPIARRRPDATSTISRTTH